MLGRKHPNIASETEATWVAFVLHHSLAMSPERHPESWTRFIILLVTSLWIATLLIGLGSYVLSGIRIRASLETLHKDNAGLADYKALLGTPSAEFTSPTGYNESRAAGIFGHKQTSSSSHFYLWAMEGIPYYWVLIICDDKERQIESVDVFKSKMW
jgi:hypothetical protein